ncbi:MAG: class I SAM-dependent RNA methyltransferase [Chitinivibrionales bacterium]|nr:class I SAM-dependent RNA methyltransferase [Chitinivibrionales bacterium]MBD3355691.1 class I SAM-dependent RNA methyltransferase [Chitinivibrionales bacterium]
MEELGEAELRELGAHKIQKAYRGVYFNADHETLYRVNYCSRFFSRFLAPIVEFKCVGTDQIYTKALGIAWERVLNVDGTFAVVANVANSRITHSQFAAFRLKDGVADYFRGTRGKRPSVDTRNPAVWLNLHVENDRATISIDTSGGALHRRGYRTEGGEAPLQETLAAAIIAFSDWDGERPLYDPMCGSGTILGEAVMRYRRIPPGYLRARFGFENLPDFNPEVWANVKKAGNENIRELPEGLIAGSDRDPKAVRIACSNLERLPGGDRVRLSRKEFSRIDHIHNSTIVTNPPYGLRMGDPRLAGQLIKAFGDFLKNRCTGSTAYVYLGDRALIPELGLHTSFKKQLFNGPLDGRLVKLELYAGKRGSDDKR